MKYLFFSFLDQYFQNDKETLTNWGLREKIMNKYVMAKNRIFMIYLKVLLSIALDLKKLLTNFSWTNSAQVFVAFYRWYCDFVYPYLLSYF